MTQFVHQPLFEHGHDELRMVVGRAARELDQPFATARGEQLPPLAAGQCRCAAVVRQRDAGGAV